MDNGADWIVHDLACLLASVVRARLPLFFTPDQWRQTLDAASVNANRKVRRRLNHAAHSLTGPRPCRMRQALFSARQAPRRTARTAKITFTSGSTGSPKGIVPGRYQLAVAVSLAAATRPLGILTPPDRLAAFLCCWRASPASTRRVDRGGSDHAP